MTPIDLLVHSAAQLCTVPPGAEGGPQRGTGLGDLGIVEDGAVAVHHGRIVAVGTTPELRQHYAAATELDADGAVICPGFVDPHTHLVWMGDRAAEFEMRIAGATYLQIMAAGGGIMSTVKATRGASVEALVEAAVSRLDQMLIHGTTTVEIKTGYGLETSAELRQLEAIAALSRVHPVTVIPTFLGAHVAPVEYTNEIDRYVAVVVEEMLPAVVTAARALGFPGLPFCDVFCDEGAFDVLQSRCILTAARDLGFPLKMHVDEFAALGGTQLAVELGAVSADHLVVSSAADLEVLGHSDTVGVALPSTPFGLGQCAYTPAGALLAAGGILALATDCNPGTAWNTSMPFVMALACRAMRITPAQALVAATRNAAFALGLGECVGSLLPGYVADLVVLDLPDYRHLGYRFGANPVTTVIKGGRIVVSEGRLVSRWTTR